jgi:hypothetical protein
VLPLIFPSYDAISSGIISSVLHYASGQSITCSSADMMASSRAFMVSSVSHIVMIISTYDGSAISGMICSAERYLPSAQPLPFSDGMRRSFPGSTQSLLSEKADTVFIFLSPLHAS